MTPDPLLLIDRPFDGALVLTLNRPAAMNALSRARAKELSLTGNFIGADRAERRGLVNRVVAAQDLLPESLALARDMLSTMPEMLLAHKRVIDSGHTTALDKGMRLEFDAARAWARTIETEQIGRRAEAVRARGGDPSRALQ